MIKSVSIYEYITAMWRENDKTVMLHDTVHQTSRGEPAAAGMTGLT